MSNNENLSLMWEVSPNAEAGTCVRIYSERNTNALVIREESAQGEVIGKLIRYESELLKNQLDEQLRLNGIGQERELKLMAELGTLKSQLAKADEVIEKMKSRLEFIETLKCHFSLGKSGCNIENTQSLNAARTYLAQRKAEK